MGCSEPRGERCGGNRCVLCVGPLSLGRQAASIRMAIEEMPETIREPLCFWIPESGFGLFA